MIPPKGDLIGDDAIRAHYGDEADAIIAELDNDQLTKAFGVYFGKRKWSHVEEFLKRYEAARGAD